MKIYLKLTVAALLPLAASAAPMLCQTANAAAYIALGSTGCLDPGGVLISNFGFSTNGNLIPLSSVTVSMGAPDLFIANNKQPTTGITVTFSPAFTAAPSTPIGLSLGFTATYPGSVRILFDAFHVIVPTVNGSHSFITFDETVALDGNVIFNHIKDHTDNNSSSFQSPGMPASSVDTRLSFPIWDDTTGRSISAIEIGIVAAPEPSSWLTMLSGLALAGLLIKRQAH